jgi:hypothetical protein
VWLVVVEACATTMGAVEAVVARASRDTVVVVRRTSSPGT